MKTKTLIAKTLSKKELFDMKRLTTANIAFRILKIMEKHIGADNEISRGKLFKKIFGRNEEITLADDLRWDYVKKAMHLCRQKTKCFIGSRYNKGRYNYFVLETMEDATYYIETLNRNIQRMQTMKRKAVTSVDKGWSNLNWIDDVKEKKQLGHTGKIKI